LMHGVSLIRVCSHTSPGGRRHRLVEATPGIEPGYRALQALA
jgi:hypothetical protein